MKFRIYSKTKSWRFIFILFCSVNQIKPNQQKKQTIDNQRKIEIFIRQNDSRMCIESQVEKATDKIDNRTIDERLTQTTNEQPKIT